jgi:hypothetical protein
MVYGVSDTSEVYTENFAQCVLSEQKVRHLSAITLLGKELCDWLAINCFPWMVYAKSSVGKGLYSHSEMSILHLIFNHEWEYTDAENMASEVRFLFAFQCYID